MNYFGAVLVSENPHCEHQRINSMASKSFNLLFELLTWVLQKLGKLTYSSQFLLPLSKRIPCCRTVLCCKGNGRKLKTDSFIQQELHL